MKTISAREAKNGFGRLIDTARAEPVLIEKHGRGVVVVVAVEEYERMKDAMSGDRETVKAALVGTDGKQENTDS